MDVSKLVILLCCTSLTMCSNEHHSHTIPVEGYEAELQNLGEHVEIPETPVRVIKITKTIAVKVPVPYPVKVIEKVPYPVHVNKPYPVPVPHIVNVPHSEQPNHILHHGHEALDITHSQNYQNQNQIHGNSYQVQEGSPLHDEHYEGPNNSEGSYGYNETPHGNYEGYNSDYNSFNPVQNSYQKF